MKQTMLALFLGCAVCTACANELLVLAPLQNAADGDVADGDSERDAGEFGVSRPPDSGSSSDDDARSAGDALVDGDMVGPKAAGVLVTASLQTCAVYDRALFCWGDNSFGQLGVGDSMPRSAPARVVEGDFLDVCAGDQHTCALRADGTALCWGSNDRGELGLGDFRARDRPVAVPDSRFVAIACGGFNTCALTPRGELYCWGENWEGKLGQGDAVSQSPGAVPDTSSPLRVASTLTFRQVSVGQGHVCAIAEGGALYCWGRNTEAQLGIPDETIQVRAPRRVAPDTAFVRVAAGQRHSCAIDREGELSCWGDSGDGALGTGVEADAGLVRTPMQVGGDADYLEIAVAWFHSCARKRDGSLYCWGRNLEGQLGLGTRDGRTKPARVAPELGWRSISVGRFHTCGWRVDGLHCWGANDEGQLGLGEFGDSMRHETPRPVPEPTFERAP